MIQPLHTFKESYSFSRRDIEEEIAFQFDYPSFSFFIEESESGHFLTITQEDVEQEHLAHFFDGDLDDMDSDTLEDAAFSLISNVTKIQDIKRMVLVDEDTTVLILK